MPAEIVYIFPKEERLLTEQRAVANGKVMSNSENGLQKGCSAGKRKENENIKLKG